MKIIKLSHCDIVYIELGNQTLICKVTGNCISILDSYLIKDDSKKQKAIKYLLDNYPNFKIKRTAKGILNEWKVHNAFYQRGWLIDRTKDTDIELNQNIINKLLYFVVSKLIKERK